MWINDTNQGFANKVQVCYSAMYCVIATWHNNYLGLNFRHYVCLTWNFITFICLCRFFSNRMRQKSNNYWELRLGKNCMSLTQITNIHEPYSYYQYWAGTRLQLRPMWESFQMQMTDHNPPLQATFTQMQRIWILYIVLCFNIRGV